MGEGGRFEYAVSKWGVSPRPRARLEIVDVGRVLAPGPSGNHRSGWTASPSTQEDGSRLASGPKT
jgi:hypothetical protein